MDSVVKTKIPVDYVKDKEGHDTLIYCMIETLASNAPKYKEDRMIIEKIFADINYDYKKIGQRIKKIIGLSFDNPNLLRFLMAHEWILRFAYKNDLALLLTNHNFIIAKENVKVPYDAYISTNDSVLFTKVEQVPVWEKRKVNYQTSIIEWLVTDKHNTFGERLSALILGDFKLALEILTNNEWLLMFVDEQDRIDIMNQCHIPITTTNKVIGCDHARNLVKKKMTIPTTLIPKYRWMERELERIVAHNDLDEFLINYAYNHSLNNCINDDNYLIRENLWLLQLVDIHTKSQLMHILNIENRDSKKKYIITVAPNHDNKEFILYHLPVSVHDYDQYHELNEKLFALISKENFSLRELEKFTQSSPLTLKLWPWLNDYNLLSNMTSVRKLL